MIELIVEATEELASKLPAYISSNIHKSLDGTQVVNYAQWESEAVKSLDELGEIVKNFADERYTKRQSEIAKIAKFKPLFYKVCYINKA